MATAAQTFADVGRKLSGIVNTLVETVSYEWASVAAREYRERFEAKKNPYGEAWEPRPWDGKKRSSWKFGKVSSVGPKGFSLIVAAPNAKRSCVPFEPRGLGTWKRPFDEVVTNKLGILIRRLK